MNLVIEKSISYGSRSRSLTEKHAYMLRDFERGVSMGIHLNKKEYIANTCKQERVLKGIPVEYR